METIGKIEFRRRAQRAMLRRPRRTAPEVAADPGWSAELDTVCAGLGRLRFRLYWLGPLAMVPSLCGMLLALAPSASRWLPAPVGYTVPAHLWWVLVAGGGAGTCAAMVALTGLIRLAWGLEFGGPGVRRSLHLGLSGTGLAGAASALITLLGLLLLPAALGFPPLMAVILSIVLLPMPLVALLVTAQGFRFATRHASAIDEVETVLMAHAPLPPS